MVKNKSGFTLVETLLVVGFIALFSVSIFLIYTSVSRYSKDEKTKLEITQNGRILLDRLSRELRQTNDLVSVLPATKDDPDNPPLSEIRYQNGHNPDNITYIYYYLNSGDNEGEVWRQHEAYYFPEDPDTYVRWDTESQAGDPPELLVLANQPVAEYITKLEIWGSPLINIEVELAKNNSSLNLKTAVNPRNN